MTTTNLWLFNSFRIGVYVLALYASLNSVFASEPPRGVVDLLEKDFEQYQWSNDPHHMGVGDFDANGLEDISLLLNGTNDWLLSVFMQVAEHRYQVKVLDTFPGNDQEFKQRFTAQALTLAVIEQGGSLDIGGTLIEDLAENSASLALVLPADENKTLLFRWNDSNQLFGVSTINSTPPLAKNSTGVSCGYDPASGVPNPLGMRAFISVEEKDGNTTFTYEQFPTPVEGDEIVLLSTKRELVFHQMPINKAREILRQKLIYYQTLTGDDDPDGFAAIDEALTCR